MATKFPNVDRLVWMGHEPVDDDERECIEDWLFELGQRLHDQTSAEQDTEKSALRVLAAMREDAVRTLVEGGWPAEAGLYVLDDTKGWVVATTEEYESAPPGRGGAWPSFEDMVPGYREEFAGRVIRCVDEISIAVVEDTAISLAAVLKFAAAVRGYWAHVAHVTGLVDHQRKSREDRRLGGRRKAAEAKRNTRDRDLELQRQADVVMRASPHLRGATAIAIAIKKKHSRVEAVNTIRKRIKVPRGKAVRG